MAKVNSTRLRAFQSKDLEKLLFAIDRKLGFKIEIKGNPVFSKGMWTIFGVLPEDDTPMLRKVPFIVKI